ncbi:MAG: hypothetical protein IT384_03410 [Deltaproteobacteria bacterium]|nr:hypothetical protein [Deltaproteobacteria bacterium]
MPVSTLHEALVHLFQDRPTLAPELLRDVLAVEVPEYSEARILDANLSQIVPTQYHADLVVLLLDERPVFGIVVEVQLAPKAKKRLSWPLYQAALRAKLRCPACVLVVTPRAEVARWASRPFETGQPGVRFAPVVIGPGAVPWVDDLARAERAPELAILSALAHSQEPRAVEVAFAAIGAARGLDEARSAFYVDLVLTAVNAAARKQLEERMAQAGYKYQSEFARRYFDQGKAEGKAEALLSILVARGLEPSGDQRAQIEGCTDVVVLERWLTAALGAESVERVLSAERPKRKPARTKARPRKRR